MDSRKRPGDKTNLSVMLQTVTILISKPLNFGFMILGIVIVYQSILSIMNHEPIYGSGQGGIYISYMFIGLGVFLTLYCGYHVFFVRLRDQLARLDKENPVNNKKRSKR